MTPITELRNAAIGWLDLITGRQDAARHFGTTSRALLNAAGFGLVAILAGLIVLAIAWGGDWPSMTLAIALGALTMVSLALVLWLSALILRFAPTQLLTAALYAFGFSQLLRVLMLIGLNTDIGVAMLGVLGFLYFRAARLIGHQGVAIAAAIAFVAVVALVLPSAALYMLQQPGQAPALQ